MGDMTRKGFKEVQQEAMQRGLAAMKEEVKTTEPTARQGVKASYWVLPLSKGWVVGVVIVVSVSVGMLALAMVKVFGQSKDPAHVGQVASAGSVSSALTRIVPSATSPPKIPHTSESMTPTSTVPTMSATAQAYPSAMVQQPTEPPPRKPKTAPVVTVEKKNVAPVVTATVKPPAPTATPSEPSDMTGDLRGTL